MKTIITSLSIVCALLVTSASTALAQNCDTLNPEFMNYSPSLYTAQGGGYIVGNNIYDDKAKAQHYSVTSPKQISEVAVWFAAKYFTSGISASSVTLNIYDMDGTGTSTTGTVAAPGAILSSSTIFIQDIDTSNSNFMFITLPNPITVTSDYAAGIDLTNILPGDTVGIISTMDGYTEFSEKSWEKWSDDTWHSMLSTWPLDIDLAIFPIECSADVDTFCSVSFLLYPDTTLPQHWFAELSGSEASPIEYEWNWGDGTTSTGANASHTYDSAGYYTICVLMTDNWGCTAYFCDSSTYIYKTDAAMITVDVIAAPTGIEETAENTFNLYPNPASSSIQLAVGSGQWAVSIYNTQGQLVTSSVPDSYRDEKPQTTIDISSFSNGIYFLTLTNGEQTLSRKFVKE